MLPKYFICVGYGYELICAVAGDKIVLECISLYVLHVVWCRFLPMLLQQVRQCRTLERQCRTQLLQQNLLSMNCHLHHVLHT